MFSIRSILIVFTILIFYFGDPSTLHKDNNKLSWLFGITGTSSPAFVSAEVVRRKNLDYLDVETLRYYVNYHNNNNNNNDDSNGIRQQQQQQEKYDYYKYDVVVMFYAPWCKNCHALAPTYDSIATMIQAGIASNKNHNNKHNKHNNNNNSVGGVIVGLFNCEETVVHSKICDEIGITHYPSIVYFDLSPQNKHQRNKEKQNQLVPTNRTTVSSSSNYNSYSSDSIETKDTTTTTTTTTDNQVGLFGFFKSSLSTICYSFLESIQSRNNKNKNNIAKKQTPSHMIVFNGNWQYGGAILDWIRAMSIVSNYKRSTFRERIYKTYNTILSFGRGSSSSSSSSSSSDNNDYDDDDDYVTIQDTYPKQDTKNKKKRVSYLPIGIPPPVPSSTLVSSKTTSTASSKTGTAQSYDRNNNNGYTTGTTTKDNGFGTSGGGGGGGGSGSGSSSSTDDQLILLLQEKYEKAQKLARRGSIKIESMLFPIRLPFATPIRSNTTITNVTGGDQQQQQQKQTETETETESIPNLDYQYKYNNNNNNNNVINYTSTNLHRTDKRIKKQYTDVFKYMEYTGTWDVLYESTKNKKNTNNNNDNDNDDDNNNNTTMLMNDITMISCISDIALDYCNRLNSKFMYEWIEQNSDSIQSMDVLTDEILLQYEIELNQYILSYEPYCTILEQCIHANFIDTTTTSTTTTNTTKNEDDSKQLICKPNHCPFFDEVACRYLTVCLTEDILSEYNDALFSMVYEGVPSSSLSSSAASAAKATSTTATVGTTAKISDDSSSKSKSKSKSSGYGKERKTNPSASSVAVGYDLYDDDENNQNFNNNKDYGDRYDDGDNSIAVGSTTKSNNGNSDSKGGETTSPSWGLKKMR